MSCEATRFVANVHVTNVSGDDTFVHGSAHACGFVSYQLRIGSAEAGHAVEIPMS